MKDRSAPSWDPLPLPTAPGEMRADAYLSWAQATEFRDARQEPAGAASPWLKVLLGLKEGCSAAAFAHEIEALRQAWLWVPGHYARPPKWLEATRYCTAIVRKEVLAHLAGTPPAGVTDAGLTALLNCLGQQVERFEIGFESAAPDFAAGAPAPAAPAKGTGLPPNAVVVGVIDDGLAFANRRFCVVDAQGGRSTRLLGLWDQGAETRSCDPLWGTGHLHTRKAIDECLTAAGQGGAFDEDAAYHLAGYRDVRHRITHGTHVMDLACGADATPEGKPVTYIVGVQLPPTAIADTSCASMTPFLLDAIRYIVSTADVAARGACPVVVNCSMGNIAGPHDGSSMLERAVDEIITLRREVEYRFEIVLPEGNSLQSQTHAWAEMEQPGVEFSLDWLIKPDDGTSSFLELWFRPKSRNLSSLDHLAVELTVAPPGGGPVVRLTLDTADGAPRSEPKMLVADGQTVALCGLYAHPANGKHPMGLLTVAPTACYGPWSHRAPSGAWRITVKNLGASIYCNVYVQRDDVAFGRGGRGRQGVLDDTRAALQARNGDQTHYERYDKRGALQLRDGDPPAFVRRVGTINGLATGSYVQVVGGVQRTAGDGLVGARYSSVAIPTTPDEVLRSRLLAVTEDSALLHGVLASGSRSGACVALSGTSMAAPQLAREIAQDWLDGVPPARGAGGPAPAADDANQTRRSVIALDADLARRSQRRRGLQTRAAAAYHFAGSSRRSTTRRRPTST